jgi:hypothetical protein
MTCNATGNQLINQTAMPAAQIVVVPCQAQLPEHAKQNPVGDK